MSIFASVKDENDQPVANMDHFVRLGYTQLSILRRELAQSEGIDLMQMEGYGEGETSWDEVDTSLRPFLDHPDDEGSLSPRECFEVYPTMERILEGWRDDSHKPEMITDIGLEIVEVMKACSKNGWELTFS